MCRKGHSLLLHSPVGGRPVTTAPPTPFSTPNPWGLRAACGLNDLLARSVTFRNSRLQPHLIWGREAGKGGPNHLHEPGELWKCLKLGWERGQGGPHGQGLEEGCNSACCQLLEGLWHQELGLEVPWQPARPFWLSRVYATSEMANSSRDTQIPIQAPPPPFHSPRACAWKASKALPSSSPLSLQC